MCSSGHGDCVLMKPPLLVAAAAVAVGAAVCSLVFGPGTSGRSASAASTVISVDVDPGSSGVQSAITLPAGANFHVRVRLESLGPASYSAYQVKLEYNDVVLDGGPPGNAGAIPSAWANAPTG